MDTPPFNTAKPRHSRKRHPVSAPPSPPPVALTLVSATYIDAEPSVVLGFDRAIDIGGMEGGVIFVDDGEVNDLLYNGSGGWSLENATTVKIVLLEVETSHGTGILLNAPDQTGIVAVDDGAAWAGATNLELPFP
jgi:hypothetical protein